MPQSQSQPRQSLMSVVSALAVQREARRREIEDQESAKYHLSLDHSRNEYIENKELEAAEEEEKQYWAARVDEWKQDIDQERAKRREAREDRKRPSRIEVDWIVDELIMTQLHRMEPETMRQWYHRFVGIKKTIVHHWNRSRDAILANQPRYLEGLPASMILFPPRPRPHFIQQRTGREACLQCVLKGMRCSHPRYVRKINREAPCRRCLRSGEKCLAARDDETEAWRFADAASTWDPGAHEEKETKERRRREQRALVDEVTAKRPDTVGSTMQLVEKSQFALPMWKRKDESLPGWKHLTYERIGADLPHYWSQSLAE